MGSAPIGNTGGIEYAIEVYASNASYGPGALVCEVPDAVNLGWSCYDRLPGKAFFTVPQTSPLINIVNIVTPGALGAAVATYHVAIWRITTAGAVLVFRGILMDTDDTGDDVIYSAYDYKALLSLSRSGFRTMYPTKLLGSQIVSPEWVNAKTTTTFSPLAFVTTGTIEDPLGADGVTAIQTNAQFGTLDQTRLQLFFDLTEMGRANTDNRVTFEITPANVFNFWRNQGGAAPFELSLNGTVTDYAFTPGWTHYRNDLATLGVGSTGGSAEMVTVGDTANLRAMGRRQDVTTLTTLAGIAGGLTETDQQKAALEGALWKLLHYPGNLSLRIERGTIDPSTVLMNDRAYIEIANGRDSLLPSSVRPFIVGKRVFYDENGEELDIIVQYDIGSPFVAFVLDSFTRGADIGPINLQTIANWLGTATCGVVWSNSLGDALAATTVGGVTGGHMYVTTTTGTVDGTQGSSLALATTPAVNGSHEIFLEGRFRWTCPVDLVGGLTPRFAIGLAAGAGLTPDHSIDIRFSNAVTQIKARSILGDGPGATPLTLVSGSWYRFKWHYNPSVLHEVKIWLDGTAEPAYQDSHSLVGEASPASLTHLAMGTVTVKGGTGGNFELDFLQLAAG